MSWIPCSVRSRAARRWLVALMLAAALKGLAIDTARALSLNAATVTELIAAINTANGNGQANVISLVAGRVYTLSTVDNGAAGDETGLPRIVGDLTIAGNGAIIERSGAPNVPAFRIFAVNGGAALALSGLTVRNGSIVGSPPLSHPPGTGFPGDNGAAAVGGGVFVANGGSLRAFNCVFMGNSAMGGAGGNGTSGSSGGAAGPGGRGGNGGSGGGGAIGNLGTLTVRGTTFTNNSAAGGAGGNGGDGGTASGSPGGQGGTGGSGGVGSGGAIQTANTLTVTNATFAANRVVGGAGGNGGAGGAGTAPGIGGGGGNGASGQGGAISHSGAGMLTATNVTIARNSAAGAAGGMGNGTGDGAGGVGIGGGIRNGLGISVTLKNALLAANIAGDGNCGGTPVQDGGFNLDFDPSTTCNFVNNAQSGDPVLGSLVDHGGPTPTLDIAPGGTAAGTGDPTVCAATTGAAPVGGLDQRGLARPVVRCSIGAFEPQAAPFPTVASISPASGTRTGGASVTLTGTGFASGVAVVFGGVAAAVTLVDATHIIVTTPAHASGTVEVVVTNLDMQSATMDAAYTFGVVRVLPAVRVPGTVGAAVKPLPSARPPSTPTGGGIPSRVPPRR